ncbi:histone-lysine N-methyltransferase SETD1A-like [Anopheles ziemanni]|uniref:histone-lysine N-methyltransferase SETD1A-like n=1 Tax=Anopheles coustani TaxID=139045 RepID=UPI0026582D75|nr:histone-lysine N-methyltransferase SETD1A-like [Anopheles coustani]XP_058170634.1 histone-lysine N-methyltransferase SETD1A-like [Anopheles ziemanni]
MTTTSASPVQGGARSCRIAPKQRTPSEGTDSGNSRETWISTNKILNSSLCGRRTNSRNPNFDYDETKLLISLWGDPQVQKTLITTHKKHPVIAELARKMREQGYSRSTEEINTRIKNLKCFYNRIKKDMAAGIINQTTWRHYAEMDEIISRPVFGNAHRVHLIQQQKSQGQQQQQHGQDQRTGGTRVRKAMTSDEGEDEDEDMPLDQFPVKLEVMSDDDDEATEIRAEDLLTIDAKFPEDNIAGSGGGTSGKPNRKTNANGRHAGASNGKNGKQTDDEDDDDDDDDDDDEEDDDEGSDFDVENEFNDGLDELLLKAQSKGAHGSSAKPTYTISSAATTSKPANSCGLVIEKISSANGTTITATSSASSTTAAPTAGKISVVPTNLLMKQPTVSTNLATPIQIYTQPTVSLAPTSMMGTVGVTKVTTAGKPGQTGVVTATPGSTGVTPMKLLLVNTVAKDGTTKQILTPASEVPTMPQLLPAPNYHAAKIPLALPGKSSIVSIPAVNVHAKVADPSKDAANASGTRKTGQSAGFKSLLTQLVTIQRENLTINQERLALEKERLEFEKQFGGSFVSMVRNMSSFFSGMLQHQRKDLKPKNDPAPPAEPQALMKKPEEDNHKPEDDHSSMAAKDTTPIESNGSASSSPIPASDPLETVPASKKRHSSESDTVEKDKSDKSPPKEPESSSSPVPSTNQTVDSSQNSPSSDIPLPKKRRMMTRNSTQHSQVPPLRISTPDEALKTEVISDNDER